MAGVLSGFTLKLLMAALMVLDHLHYFFPGVFPDWFNWLGRLVAPTFCYLMTQGLKHTSDRGRYIRRMLTAGILMMVGNLMLSAALGGVLTNNILLSLGVSAAILTTCDMLRYGGDRKRNLLLLLFLVLLSTLCEGSLLVPAMALVFYYLRHNRPLMCAAYLVVSAAMVWLLFPGVFPQLLMVGAVVPILLYNGKRGPGNAFAKWFFYVFYPLHVWVLFALSRILLA